MVMRDDSTRPRLPADPVVQCPHAPQWRLHRLRTAMTRRLGLARPEDVVRLTIRAKAAPHQGFLSGRLGRAVTTLRQRGYTPVHAQRSSDLTTEETGLWIVGRKVLTVDEVITLAERF